MGDATGAADGGTGGEVGRRLRIRGDVQGVGFRHNCRVEAGGLGLRGWVRNVDDGSVEVLVAGPARDVHTLVDWCRVGPRHATVTDVDVEDVDPAAVRSSRGGFGVR